MNHDKATVKRCDKTGRWKPAAAMFTPEHRGQQKLCVELNKKELEIADQNEMYVDDLRKYLLRSQGNVNKQPF